MHACGRAEMGQLGRGSDGAQLTPQLVDGLAAVQIVAVRAAGDGSEAMSSAGERYAWGAGVGRLPTRQTPPAPQQ